MKNKRICKTLSALCLTMVVAFGFTIPAFAQGSEQAPAAPAEDSTNDSNVIVEETEPAPALTPDGNAALVDDLVAISSSLPLPPRRATISISSLTEPMRTRNRRPFLEPGG